MDSGSEINQENELLLSLLSGEEAGSDIDIKLQNQLIQMEESIQAGINASTLSYLYEASKKENFQNFRNQLISKRRI